MKMPAHNHYSLKWRKRPLQAVSAYRSGEIQTHDPYYPKVEFILLKPCAGNSFRLFQELVYRMYTRAINSPNGVNYATFLDFFLLALADFVAPLSPVSVATKFFFSTFTQQLQIQNLG